MTVSRTHPGHTAAAIVRMDAARERYATRRNRRPKQVWLLRVKDGAGYRLIEAPAKGAEGAVPTHIYGGGTNA